MSKLGSGLLRLLLLLLALAALTAGELQWRVCDEDAAPFRPTAVSIKPDPPVIGADVEFSIQGVSGALAPRGGQALECPATVSFAPLNPPFTTRLARRIDPSSLSPFTDTVVSSGTLDIGVSFQGMDIFSGSEDLCGRTSCPIAPGPLRIAVQQYLPPIAPPVRHQGQGALGFTPLRPRPLQAQAYL